MHSRCGLQTEYMSSEWFSLVGSTADFFADQNMQGWLYDEDRWPSGSCGGMATEKLENRQKALSMYIGKDDTIYADKQVLGVFAIKLIGEAEKSKVHFGKCLADYIPLKTNDVIPQGYEKAVFVVEFIHPSDFYNGNTYLDTLNKNAVQDFISLTHEKYKAAIGSKFGNELMGIFLDEPHRGGVFNGFNITNQNAQAMLPWSYDTFPLYFEKFNERIEDKLPELFFSQEGEDFNRTIWQYLEVLQTQFLQAFAQPYYMWCKQNNLLVTGHVWDENTLLGQINWQGSVMRYYEYMDIPGIDNLRDDNYFFAAPLQAVSVAKQTGRKKVLSEMYACTGWKTPFDYYKRSGDWQALLGINVRCPHLSWYTMGGEAKRDCPASIFFQAAWYQDYKHIEDYFARLNATFGQAEYLTDILLLSPIESAWGLVRAGAYTATERFRKLETDWRNIIDEMLFNGVDFDIADEDILSRKAYIQVQDGQPSLVVGQMQYKVVVLPPLIHVRASTLSILKAFVSHGGKVICTESLPSYVNGIRTNVALTVKFASILSLAEECKKACKTTYSVAFSGKMLSKRKKSGHGELLFMVAFDCADGAKAKIVLNGVHNLAKINLRMGEVEDIEYRFEDGNTILETTFAKGEELLLSIDDKKSISDKAECEREVLIQEKDFAYELSEPNVMPLDYAEYWIDGVYQGCDEFLKIDKCIRAKFGLKERSANNQQPWFEEKYHRTEYHKNLCRVKLKYTFSADMVPSNAQLMVEALPNAEWYLNGKKLYKSQQKPFIEDVCFTCFDLHAKAFKLGENIVEVVFDFTPACNLETAYLTGDFSVNIDTHVLQRRSQTLHFGDICTQGFPFYTGAITYKIPVEPGVYDIKNLHFGAACVKVRDKIAAFAPFEIKGGEATDGILPLTAVLLRRNLFGPLHEIPKNHGNYWSGSFRTEGDKFSKEYQINQQGIFEMPKLYVRSERNE